MDKNGSSAVFTGDKNLDWKGAIAKRNFVAMGNYLVNDKVVDAMVSAFEGSAENILEERLMLSIEAGRNAGGEKGGHFSNSIKSVAPALAPEFGYDDLHGVADGLAASGAFLQLASGAVTAPEEIADLRSQLLAYCERDTLAMVEVHRALTRLAAQQHS